MIPLSLNWTRCPDGVELFDYGAMPGGNRVVMGQFGPHFRFRSDRRQEVSYEAADLENPIVLHFLNVRTPDEWLPVLSRFGMYGEGGDVAVASLERWQSFMHGHTCGALTGTPAERAATVNTLLDSVSLAPTFDFSGPDQKPRLVYRPMTLGGFMRMEVAVAVMNDVALTTCEHCGRMFFTGPLTGRRSHAKFCSDKCRVAAMRKRNAGSAADRN